MRGVLAAGSRLRSYELVSVLGRGAFGITYRARDTTLERDVAIKEYLPTSLALREGDTMVMPLSTALAEEFVWGRDRFLEEARTLATLGRAPAVARIYDFLESAGHGHVGRRVAPQHAGISEIVGPSGEVGRTSSDAATVGPSEWQNGPE